MKCAIAYDNDKGRDGLRSLVSANRDWELCADARIDRDAYELALKTQPDVVVMDVAVPAFGISLARLLRDDLPGASCLLFTNVYGIDTVTSAVAADVKGYVLKREGQHVLAAAINMLGAGSRYYSPAVVDIIVEAADKPLRREPKAFTLRELEIPGLSQTATPTRTSHIFLASAPGRSNSTAARRCAKLAHTPAPNSSASPCGTNLLHERIFAALCGGDLYVAFPSRPNLGTKRLRPVSANCCRSERALGTAGIGPLPPCRLSSLGSIGEIFLSGKTNPDHILGTELHAGT